MDIETIITTVASLFGTLSLWEIVRYFLNRRTNMRIEEAQADTSEFSVLREVAQFLQEQLKSSEERYADQTKRLRETQDENFRILRENSLLKLTLSTHGIHQPDESNNIEN